MAPSLQTALDRFNKECDFTLDWLGATEALWVTSPPTSDIRQRLKTPQLEALYEAAYLRIFTAWEVFQEDMTVRMMARAGTPTWNPRPVSGQSLYSTIVDARQALYGQRFYILWHDPTRSANLIGKHLDGCPLQQQLIASKSWLEFVGHVRHRIAHASDDARQKFGVASNALTGTTHKGIPGRLLRAKDYSDPLNPAMWIRRISDELREIATRSMS